MTGQGSITVTSPSVDDALFLGETYEILWSSEEIEGSLQIELYHSATPVLTISSNTSNDGIFSWDIALNLSTGSEYTIVITSLSSNISGVSGIFSIFKRYVNITSPTSESIWYQGETSTITWTSEYIGEYVNIELYKGSSFVEMIESNKINDGTYTWNIPYDLETSSNYMIKITSTSYPVVYDFSEQFAFGRSITIRSPLYGEIVYQGSNYTISWTSENLESTVDIELYKGNIFVDTIQIDAPNDGSQIWQIPFDLETDSDYRIRIRSTTYPNVYDFSEKFAFGRTIQIKSPSNSVIWYKNEEYTIMWDSENIDQYVTIEIYNRNSKISTIDAQTFNDGTYSWTVPSDLDIGGRYTIKITSTSYPGVYDYSNEFAIETRFLTVTAPTKNDVWYQGEEYLITWESINAGSCVSIQLFEGSSQLLTIESNTSNDGSYLWEIPWDVPYRTSLKVRIKSTSIDTVYNTSESFTFGRMISITSPTSKNVCFKGENYSILWVYKNIGTSVTLELYRGSSMLMEIGSKISNKGSKSWYIPNELDTGSNYRVRIVSDLYDQMSEYSEYFSIDERFILITSPSIVETWQYGYFSESYTIEWDCLNIGEYVDIELYNKDQYISTIAKRIENDGAYIWKLPSDLEEGNEYKIKIMDHYNNEVTAWTDSIRLEPTFTQRWKWAIILIVIVSVILLTVAVVVQTDNRKRMKKIEDEKKEILELMKKSVIDTPNTSKRAKRMKTIKNIKVKLKRKTKKPEEKKEEDKTKTVE